MRHFYWKNIEPGGVQLPLAQKGSSSGWDNSNFDIPGGPLLFSNQRPPSYKSGTVILGFGEKVPRRNDPEIWEANSSLPSER